MATQMTTDSLKAYPDLQGIFGLTSVALPGAAEALRKAARRKNWCRGMCQASAISPHTPW